MTLSMTLLTNTSLQLSIVFMGLMLIASTVVIFAQHPVTSVIALALVYLNACGLLLMIGAEFLALAYLMVYIGAIVVLFLFLTMLLNMKILVYQVPLRNYTGVVLILLPLWVYLMCSSFTQLMYSDVWDYLIYGSAQYAPEDKLEWIAAAQDMHNTQVLGYVLYNHYYLHFIFIGVLLTVALIISVTFIMHSNIDAKKQTLHKQLATVNHLKMIQVTVTKDNK